MEESAFAICAVGSVIRHERRWLTLEPQPVAIMKPATTRAKTPGRKGKSRRNDDYHGENGTDHLRLIRKPTPNRLQLFLVSFCCITVNRGADRHPLMIGARCRRVRESPRPQRANASTLRCAGQRGAGAARAMARKSSALRLAPPISAPSTYSRARMSFALEGLTEPP